MQYNKFIVFCTHYSFKQVPKMQKQSSKILPLITPPNSRRYPAQHSLLRLLFTACIYKKAQLTPRLARDSADTWRIILNSDTAAAIEALTCAAT